jgi:hypothetical protein
MDAAKLYSLIADKNDCICVVSDVQSDAGVFATTGWMA